VGIWQPIEGLGGIPVTLIKICGITNLEDACRAMALGADALGFIFAPSPRKTDPSNVQRIVRNLPGPVLKVGVFVDEEVEKVNDVTAQCALDLVQLHGRESPEYCAKVGVPVIKALRVEGNDLALKMERYPGAVILLDSGSGARAGGTGKPFDWELARKAEWKRGFILSAGLNPQNVGEAIRLFRPLAVDVCSGLEESPGKKDLRKMADFVAEVRRADRGQGEG
jgi:phosphoribosylanthranilate isomerase